VALQQVSRRQTFTFLPFTVHVGCNSPLYRADEIRDDGASVAAAGARACVPQTNNIGLRCVLILPVCPL